MQQWSLYGKSIMVVITPQTVVVPLVLVNSDFIMQVAGVRHVTVYSPALVVPHKARNTHRSIQSPSLSSIRAPPFSSG